MKLKIYQVDAFAEKVFSGNPAAVCPLHQWLPDELMQNIALENNLAETAFYVPVNNEFHIRWFTPAVEVDLCGHATLAAAYVLFHYEGFSGNTIHFHSHRSGSLKVTRNMDLLTLDFPTDTLQAVELTGQITAGFNIQPVEAYKGKTDYMLVFESEDQITALEPDFSKVAKLPARGVIVTAPGKQFDFVSRFFAPQSGINEDPVTGSAHTSLTPYWFKKLGKKELSAAQLSPRKGILQCTYNSDRTGISGKAALYLQGEISV